MRTISGRWAVAIAVLLLSSCDEGTTGPSATVATVGVIPGVFSMVVGDSVRLAILLRDKVGYPLTGRSVAWTTSQPAVVTVSQAGTVSAVGPGSASITATVEGKTGTALVTVSPSFPAAAFVSVALGGAHSCALTASGTAHCWGRGESGQLGVPPPEMMCLLDLDYPCSLVPVPVNGGLVFQRLTGGQAHTCGLTSDGSAYCWGSNTKGQLGDNSTTDRHAPVAVATGLKFASIDAGPEHTCALTSDGAAYCWGRNDRGQLGDSSTTSRSVPVAVTGGLTFRTITAGGAFWGDTCALTAQGDAWCWGENGNGQLGIGSFDGVAHSVPALVSASLKFTTLTAGGGNQVCGLTAAGAAYCWGYNSNGALGDGSRGRSSPLPVPVSGGIVFTHLVAGGYSSGHTCGLTSSGVGYCWGDNEAGSIGDGTVDDRLTPTAVTGGLSFVSIDAGFRHSCARTTAGTVYCWGSGRAGQLGANSAGSSTVPLKVTGQP